MKVLFVLGTRPEAIKMAPVIREARARGVETRVCVTGQHREMLDPVLDLFSIDPDFNLDLMQPGQTLASLTARVLLGLEKIFDAIAPDWVLVQGDTTTAMTAALAAFYRQIPVGHIEAGLRTQDLARPFPEELNRRIADLMSVHHFVPTLRARENLKREGYVAESLFLTGNTVVDALQWIGQKPWEGFTGGTLPEETLAAPIVLVTAHRRESFGVGLQAIAGALRDIAAQNADAHILYPVHRNPEVLRVMEDALGGVDRIHLLPPLDYQPFVQLMSRARLILTDSGGVQEEAPSLGVPTLVLRETTERPEALEAGVLRLVGVDRQVIVREANLVLQDPATHDRVKGSRNPYGDGRAAQRIVSILLEEPWAEFRA